MLEQKCSQNVHPDFLVLKLRGLSSLPGFPHVGGAGMPRRAGVHVHMTPNETMAKLIRWLLSASLVLLSYLVTCLLPYRDPPLLNWGKGILNTRTVSSLA